MSDRDANGRFRDGCRPGPGRPRRQTETDYLRSLSDAIPLERWGQIVAKAVDQAVAGDAKARDWLSAYLVGKPTGDGLAKLADAEARAADPLARRADEAIARFDDQMLALIADD